MVTLAVLAGRRIAEVSWPAYSRRKGGTCDFMTTQCAKHCVLTTNRVEGESLAFFEDNEPPAIVREMVNNINELGASVLCWFIGSGDCPERMTGKIISVVATLSDMNIRQHGFTRNLGFWHKANQFPKCSIVLTVEKGDEEKMSKAALLCRGDHTTPYLIAEPNYKKDTVRIYRLGLKAKYQSYRCGGGWVIRGSGWAEENVNNRPPARVTVEDCSLCLENNDGCYSLSRSLEAQP